MMLARIHEGGGGEGKDRDLALKCNGSEWDGMTMGTAPLQALVPSTPPPYVIGRHPLWEEGHDEEDVVS
jgi:hypothetical protein